MKKVEKNQKIIEIKHYLDKPSKFYECEFIQFNNDIIVTKYVLENKINLFSKNVVSYGFFWLKKNYISYSFYDLDNASHLASRYDICSETKFQKKPFLAVTFLDLYLDYWVKGDKFYWEDDRELFNAKLNKTVDQFQINIIRTTKIELEQNILKIEKEKKKILFD